MSRFAGFKLWSNAFFLIPLGYAFAHSFYAYALVVAGVIGMSLLFHISEEKRFFYIDVATSTMLMIANLVLIDKAGWPYPYAPLAVILVGVSFLFYFRAYVASTDPRRRYSVNHGIWHLCSALISLCCVVAYSSIT